MSEPERTEAKELASGRVFGVVGVTPILRPIKTGWAAQGDGWAVHGATKQEAIDRFYERVEFYARLDRRARQATEEDIHG